MSAGMSSGMSWGMSGAMIAPFPGSLGCCLGSFGSCPRSYLDFAQGHLYPGQESLDSARGHLDHAQAHLDSAQGHLDPAWAHLDPARGHADLLLRLVAWKWIVSFSNCNVSKL